MTFFSDLSKTFRAGVLLGVALALAVSLFAVPSASADYEQAEYEGAPEHFGPGFPREFGMAINATGAGGVETGSFYVVGPTQRVLRFAPGKEGEEPQLKEAWGWKTIESGPDLPAAEYSDTVTATSGTYTLTLAGTGWVKSADLTVTKGSNVVAITAVRFGAFHVGDAIASGNFPDGTTVEACSPDCASPTSLTLSAAATTGFPKKEMVARETTAPIQATASAGQVQDALEALPGVGAGALSVAGGPGDAEGTNPYQIVYEGPFAGVRVPPRPSATDVSLAGGVPSSAAAVVQAVDPTPTRYERCRPFAGDVCTAPSSSFGGEETGHFNTPGAVAVDQATGYVYVLNQRGPGREHHLVEVFSATGTPVGEGFGDGAGTASNPGPFEESPEKLHKMFGSKLGLAVDEAGTVYVTDEGSSEAREARVMCFKPEHPEDYEHYAYCGRAHDITTSTQSFTRIALTGADRIVAAGEHLIRTYALGGGSTAICTYQIPIGQLGAMTADPVTGEVFYYADVPDFKLHRLGPCDESKGEFKEVQAPVAVSPGGRTIYALALNPGLVWGPGRPPGTVYSVDGGLLLPTEGIGDIFVPAEVFPPAVQSESVANTTSDSATLEARIDPRGFTTRYRFQYLPASTYGAQKAAAEGEGMSGEEAEDAGFAGAAETPAEAGTIGAGAVASAAATASTLSPDTAYRFRVLAGSFCDSGHPGLPCETSGEAASFATYPPPLATPPDGRAYELVSPAEKHGGEAFPPDPVKGSCPSGECKPPGGFTINVFPMRSTPDGDAVTYMGYAFSPSEGAGVFNSYVSRRTGSGWRTDSLSPSLLDPVYGANLAVDAALGRGLIFQRGDKPQLSADAPPGYTNLYLQDTSDPASLHALLTGAPPNRSAGTGFQLEYAGHSPDFSAQYVIANDALTGATPYAPAPPDPGQGGHDLYEWREGQLSLVNVLPGNAEVAAEADFVPAGSYARGNPDAHGVSRDGSRVFWEAGGRLYVREVGKLTREVHHSGGAFLTASPDGLRVLLADGCLYSLASASCAADLTGGEGGFQGIAGTSEDLTRVYFADTKALPGSGANERGQSAQEGQPNLYLYEAGAGTRFIATLLPGDGLAEGLGDWAAAPSRRGAEASPGGRYLAFGSRAQLSGYDSTGPCERSNEGGWKDSSCAQVFLYDSVTGQLTCPSCNPTGEAPRGPSTLSRIHAEPSWQPQPRYLTDSGRLYFDSQDRLSPRDANGRVEDVYEYEPSGAGSCARAGGCVSLITPGSGSVDSNFLALDETGANVFFTTRERLVLSDTDELVNVYDAREAGGFAAAESETTQPECQGEACQPSPEAPSQPNLGSTALRGAGNVSEPSTGASRCTKPARRAQSLSRRAKKPRRNARRVARHNPRRAKRMRRKASRLATQARRQSKQARRCRARARNNRRTAR